MGSLQPEHSNEVKSTTPLKVCIAGAGIGGLSAAIALRQAGHQVEMYESSRFAMEIGAAIHLPPNVGGLLRRFGMKPECIGANDTQYVTIYSKEGKILSTKDVRGLRNIYPYPWQLCHRIDLHEELKRLATTESGPGTPVIINTQSAVVDCDPSAPSLTLKNGKIVTGDLVIGADGVHSVLRSIVTGETIEARPSGGSAFRFLIPVSQVKGDPRTASLLERPGELQIWEGTHRRLIAYPCRDNTELNMACLHPDVESEGSKEGWNNSVPREHLLKVCDEYNDAVKTLLSMINPSSIKLWRLLDRPALSTWIKGRTALLGDAAHPFLPHQGQGGAQAIEDGAALGALFPLGTKPEDISERLELYMRCRYDRATMVQDFSRISAFKHSDKDTVGGQSTDPMEFSKINFGHDAYDNAQGILLRHLSAKSGFIGSPSAFGPPPTLSLSPSGPTYLTAWVTFRTPLNYMKTFLPSSGLEFDVVGGWATATFSVTKLGRVASLGGRGYSRLSLYIHHVKRTTEEESASKTVSSSFCPLVFENNPDVVITTREKGETWSAFAALTDQFSEPDFSLQASWEGTPFFDMKLTQLNPSDSKAVTFDADSINGIQVLPRIDENGQKSQTEILTTLSPLYQSSPDEVSWKSETADISFTELDGAGLDHAFPTLAQFIRRLRGIKIDKVIASGVTSSPERVHLQQTSVVD